MAALSCAAVALPAAAGANRTVTTQVSPGLIDSSSHSLLTIEKGACSAPASAVRTAVPALATVTV